MELQNGRPKRYFKLKSLRIRELWTAKSFRYLIYLLTMVVILSFLSIIAFVTYQSIPLFKEFNFWDFLSSVNWKPAKDNAGGQYGIGMIILMTLILLAISMLFAIPLTIFSTLFISEYLSPAMQKKVMVVVKLLASVPSVIFGLFARDQIGALFQLMGAPNNDNLMVAAVTMTFMAAPTMISISYNAVRNVPEGYRLGSLALGISKEKTTFRIIRKSANPQIIAAIILGMARVIGETMAIMMIAGNSTGGLVLNDGISGFLFSSIRTLAATIGLEMTENSGAVHKSALFAIGLILFAIVFIINILIVFVTNVDTWKNSWNKKRAIEIPDEASTAKFKQHKISYDNDTMKLMINAKSENKFFKKSYSVLMMLLMWISTIIVISFTFWILGDVIIRGLIGFRHPSLFMSIDGGGGILAALSTTLLLVICTLMFAIPLSLGAAVYLSEYANPNAITTKAFRFIINVLASTPSIIFGIFGLSIFITLMGAPFSVLAAALTMTMVVMPMLIANFEAALAQVPTQYKEAATGLGMGRTSVLVKIIFPNAIEGMITGTILAMAKIIGESAPIYLTLGTDIQLPTEGFLSQGTTLTTSIYMIVAEGIPSQTQDTLYLLALITIALIVFLNFTAGNISSLLVDQTQSLKMKFMLKRQIHFNWKTIPPAFKLHCIQLKTKIVQIFVRSWASIVTIPLKYKKWHYRNRMYRNLKKGRAKEK